MDIENDKKINELRNTAKRNKQFLMYKTHLVTINDKQYALKIMGIGAKKVRLDLFIDYESILENKDVGVEKILYNAINKVYDLK